MFLEKEENAKREESKTGMNNFSRFWQVLCWIQAGFWQILRHFFTLSDAILDEVHPAKGTDEAKKDQKTEQEVIDETARRSTLAPLCMRICVGTFCGGKTSRRI